MTIAYAVVKDAEINIRTVGDTERMAKVNGIVVVGGEMVMASWTDVEIGRKWDAVAASHGVKIERVDVTFAD